MFLLYVLFGTKDPLAVFLYLCVLVADSLQAQLISMGVIPTLVKLLGIHSHNTALTEMCLIAFGNLAELGESTSTLTHRQTLHLPGHLPTPSSHAGLPEPGVPLKHRG